MKSLKMSSNAWNTEIGKVYDSERNGNDMIQYETSVATQQSSDLCSKFALSSIHTNETVLSQPTYEEAANSNMARYMNVGLDVMKYGEKAKIDVQRARCLAEIKNKQHLLKTEETINVIILDDGTVRRIVELEKQQGKNTVFSKKIAKVRCLTCKEYPQHRILEITFERHKPCIVYFALQDINVKKFISRLSGAGVSVTVSTKRKETVDMAMSAIINSMEDVELPRRYGWFIREGKAVRIRPGDIIFEEVLEIEKSF